MAQVETAGDVAAVNGLDKVLVKLSLDEDIAANIRDQQLKLHDSDLNHLFDGKDVLLNSVSSQSTSHLDETSQINEKIEILLSHSNPIIRNENKLELVTVSSIIKIVKYVNNLLKEPLTLDVSKKINALLISLLGAFKYHFQLPTSHNNYAFRNFGVLLCSTSINVIHPFINYIKASSNTVHELNKSETLEKTFCLLLIFHCFNKEMWNFSSDLLSDGKVANEIFYIFNLKMIKPKSSTVPSIFNIFQRFRMSILLEQSTLITETKSNNYLNIIFFSFVHKSILVDMIENIVNLKKQFDSPNLNLMNIASNISLSNSTLDYLTLFICNNIDYFKLLDDNVKQESNIESKSDLSMYLLLKISQNYITNYNLFYFSSLELLQFINEYNCSNYTSILGITENEDQSQLNVSTLIPIFEFIDQNFKLNYTLERDFLTILKLSFINLDLNLDSDIDFMNLNSLLVDVGCSMSINSLIDTIQTLLCIIINDTKFKQSIFSKIPNNFKSFLNFDYIPPVYRSDMSFENNIDLQSDNFNTTFKMFQSIENHQITIETKSQQLIEDCLTLVLSIKTKIFRFLKNLNNETNVLRLPDLFSKENKQDEYPLSVFKQGISTKIGSFKSNKSLNYKLLNVSISLNIIANLSLLVIGENYRYLKSSEYILDNSMSRIINEFTIDFTSTFLIIYQEFGLLSFFKELRILNQTNLKLILPTAILVSKLFQVKHSDYPLQNSNSNLNLNSNSNPNLNSDSSSSLSTTATTTAIKVSNFDIISDLLYKSIIASNLLRQFVELFDDGQSRPFKSLNKFLKAHPSTLKPSKISKGTVTLNLNDYKTVLALS